jgi:alkylhydroperoxidase family enzyme
MPRVREIEDDGGDPILKEIFAKETEIFGYVLNTTKVMAHTPPILKAAKQLGASIAKSGLLPAALVPLLNLRVALINGCPF